MDLGKLLGDLLQEGGTVDVRLDGYHFIIKPDSHLDRPAPARPAGPAAQPGSCVADVLAVLAEAGRPLTGPQAHAALSKKGRDYSETKVKFCLTFLCELGICQPDLPGYAVRPDAPPLPQVLKNQQVY